MSVDGRGLADVMSQVARTLDQPADLDETLQLITRTARDTIAGVDFASISVPRGGGRIETLAPTDEVVSKADDLQYELGEGPCVDALGNGRTMHATDLAGDGRWPEYGPRAAALGLGSQMALRLDAGHGTLGALNLYSAVMHAFDGDADRIATVFAAHAAVAMDSAQRHAQLNEALRTRKAIGQAIGLVMERYELDEERAFAYLVRVSQVSNTKLRDVAEELVRTTNERWGVKG